MESLNLGVLIPDLILECPLEKKLGYICNLKESNSEIPTAALVFKTH